MSLTYYRRVYNRKWTSEIKKDGSRQKAPENSTFYRVEVYLSVFERWQVSYLWYYVFSRFYGRKYTGWSKILPDMKTQTWELLLITKYVFINWFSRLQVTNENDIKLIIISHCRIKEKHQTGILTVLSLLQACK